jgi:D-beta-D-heptose 7-phosphate kinase/D-beta-D-heptose 1-phosphate adenosyltransferase
MNSAFKDVFGPGSNFAGRFIRNYIELTTKVIAMKNLGLKVVLTSGTFDLLHVGHSRYLEQGKILGDILVVGVDSDRKVKIRKGENRPIVPEEERLEVLCHLRHVDLVVLKQPDDPHWHLIKAVCPNVLLTTKGTYNPEEIEQLKEFCGEVVVLEPQAETSTSAKIRLLLVMHATEVKRRLEEATENVVAQLKSVRELVDGLFGGGKNE